MTSGEASSPPIAPVVAEASFDLRLRGAEGESSVFLIAIFVAIPFSRGARLVVFGGACERIYQLLFPRGALALVSRIVYLFGFKSVVQISDFLHQLAA